MIYRKTCNISRTLAGTKIVYQSDVVGASPVGAAPATSVKMLNFMYLVILWNLFPVLNYWGYRSMRG